MNLDNLGDFNSLDSQNLLHEINSFPDHVASAWALGQSLTLPEDFQSVRNIVIAGMGSSGMGGELAQTLAAPECPAPVSLWSNYALPAFVGRDTLVIGLSHSGDTEETVSACEAALARGARLLAIAAGGKLAALAAKHNAPVWGFGDQASRLTISHAFMLTLAALAKLGLVADKSADVEEAVAALRAQRTSLHAESPVIHNPAKRMAGQWMDRLGVVFASDYLAPVARRWKAQINWLAKAWAVFDVWPEMDHNSIAGTLYPEALVSKYMVLFLRSAHEPPRNRARADVTREIYLTAGFNTDAIEAAGQSPLAHMLTTLHYGDYAAYYLAMCYGVDPGPAPQIDYLREELGKKA